MSHENDLRPIEIKGCYKVMIILAQLIKNIKHLLYNVFLKIGVFSQGKINGVQYA